MSVAYFIHQRASAISDEPRFDQSSGAHVGAQPATIAHPCYHSELRLRCLFLMKISLGLGRKSWWAGQGGGVY